MYKCGTCWQIAQLVPEYALFCPFSLYVRYRYGSRSGKTIAREVNDILLGQGSIYRVRKCKERWDGGFQLVIDRAGIADLVGLEENGD